jgi:small-conductance mechanosensitive channel
VKKVAAENPLIIKDPAPQAFLVTFGPGPLNFELRAWTNKGEDWMQTRSDISVAIKAALAHEGLAIS